jgi:hypothetical protein
MKASSSRTGDLYLVAEVMDGPRDKTRGKPAAMGFNRVVRTAVLWSYTTRTAQDCSLDDA